MRKLLALLLVFSVGFASIGCGGGEEKKKDEKKVEKKAE